MRIRNMPWFVVMLLVVVVFIGFTYGAMAYTSRPDFCASCHEIKPAVESWYSSSHSHVKCLTCHAEPGTLGYVKRKIAGLREVYLHLSGAYSKPKAIVTNGVCLQCHGDIPQRSETKLFNFPHKNHLTFLQNCTDCHASVAHGDKVIFGQKEFTHMNSLGSTCSQCHAEQQRNSCDFCHKKS